MGFREKEIRSAFADLPSQAERPPDFEAVVRAALVLHAPSKKRRNCRISHTFADFATSLDEREVED